MTLAGAMERVGMTGAVAGSKGLYVAGFDVIAARLTPIESVSVTEMGAGGVSSMHFTIEDTGLIVSMVEGLPVRFHDITRDVPLFVGWVQAFTIIGRDVARVIDVRCVGVEAILDWMVLTADVAFPSGSGMNAAIQSLVAACPVTELRALARTSGGNSSIALPMAESTPTAVLVSALTVTAGTTLREAIRQVQAISYGVLQVGQGNAWVATVDFYMGLRSYPMPPTGGLIADWTSITVNDDTGVGTTGEPTEYTLESATVRAVFVRGTGVTGTVTDGTGMPGPVAYLVDPTVTDAAGVASVAAAYLANNAPKARGSTTWLDRAPVDTHPGLAVTLTNGRLGLSSVPFNIMQIDKSFNPSGREDWVVSFGGLAPSGVNLIRRLTRDTLS